MSKGDKEVLLQKSERELKAPLSLRSATERVRIHLSIRYGTMAHCKKTDPTECRSSSFFSRSESPNLLSWKNLRTQILRVDWCQ